MPLPRASAIALTPILFAAALAGVAACTSSETTGSGGSASTGNTTASGTGGAPATTGAGGAASCAQAATMLDVSKAPGAGDGYAKPTLTGDCTDTAFVVESNGTPTYTFVQATPNPLKEQNDHWGIPLNPVAAPRPPTSRSSASWASPSTGPRSTGPTRPRSPRPRPSAIPSTTG